MKNLRVWRWYYYLWRKRKWRIWEFLGKNWNEEFENSEILSLKKEEIKNWRVFGNRNLGNEESESLRMKGMVLLWCLWRKRKERIGESLEMKNLRVWEWYYWHLWRKRKWRIWEFFGKNWNEESESLEMKGMVLLWCLWRKRKERIGESLEMKNLRVWGWKGLLWYFWRKRK